MGTGSTGRNADISTVAVRELNRQPAAGRPSLLGAGPEPSGVLCSASFRISRAAAWAARDDSTAALRARRLLWKAISSMTLMIFETLDPLDSFIEAAPARSGQLASP